MLSIFYWLKCDLSYTPLVALNKCITHNLTLLTEFGLCKCPKETDKCQHVQFFHMQKFNDTLVLYALSYYGILQDTTIYKKVKNIMNSWQENSN